MPDNKELKQAIQTALTAFENKSLAEASLDLLTMLGYRSERRLSLVPNTARQFQTLFDSENRLNHEVALVKDWLSVDLLFQVTDAEIQQATSGMLNMFASTKMDNKDIRSYLFFALDLKGKTYNRTQLAGITREINKLFPMPVMVIFRYDEVISLAIIARRINKRVGSKDVLEKVTLIKDIRFTGNRAQIEILHDLAITQLTQSHEISNFIGLQKAWEKTLDLNELNKKFYKEIANWYFWAVKMVKFPKDAEKNEETRNATSVIRLITRLIFVWFIKEKGLVPEDLFDARWLKENLEFSDAKKSTYYKAILQNLFFATLDVPIEDRRFRSEREFQGRNKDYDKNNVFRYQSLFREKVEFEKLFQNIPFLNGGLFECLDNKKQEILIDGFSDREDNSLTVSDDLFLMEKEKEIDLNKVYDTKNKKYKVRGLIHIFNSYKFTIEENTPIEEEIALDPELLGKVFENLLAAYNPETGTTARKQTGSFYTPREIVNYMVDEALIAYLESQLKIDGGTLRVNAGLQDRLRDLLSYNPSAPDFTDNEKSRLIAAIDNVKVLDPAAGSGAFPMGMLHKLVFLLAKLDPDNELWKQKQIDNTQTSDSVVREAQIKVIEEIFTDNHNDYGRKLFLIENCIYGVDIQPIAVQIAKLRFFISLVVDQKINPKKDNLGIRPLPNLETKFVAANTLIGIQNPKAGKPVAMSFGDMLYEGKQEELKNVRKKHFSASTPAAKRKYREIDKKLRSEILEMLKKDGWGSESTQKLASWDPYDQNARAKFFDPKWMFEIEDGFDIVIGNPPYVRQEQISELKPDLQKQYSCYTGTADLYVYFYERGIQVLRKNGLLVFISSNKYFRSGYGEKLRDFLSKQTTIRNLIDFGDTPIFTAIAYPSIIVTQKKTVTENHIRTLSWKLGNLLEEFKDVINSQTFLLNQKELNSASWRLGSSLEFRLMEKLQISGKPLGEFIGGALYRGIITGLNEAIIVDEKTRNRLIAEDKSSENILKPLLRGRDIKRWQVEYSNLFIIKIESSENMTHPWTRKPEKEAEEIFSKTYPAIHKYLQDYKNALKQRDDQGKFYWELRSCTYWDIFEKDKIVWGNLASEPKFSFAKAGFYVSAPATTIVSSDMYLLGILNSNISKYIVSQNAAGRQGGFLEYKPMYVSKLTIPVADTRKSSIIKSVVEMLIKLTKPTRVDGVLENHESFNTQALEDLLNGLVYELYFPESIQAKGVGVFELAAQGLSNGVEATYKALRDPESELRARLVRQNIEVEEVRIINEALKK